MLDFLVAQTYNFLQFLINLFPVGTGFSSTFHTGVQALGGYLHILDPLVPISILLSCLTLIFGVEIAIFGFKTLKWVLSHVPMFGGKGN